MYYLNLDATLCHQKHRVCHEIAPLCHLMAHPYATRWHQNQSLFEPVTEPDSLCARAVYQRGCKATDRDFTQRGNTFPPAFKPSADHIAIASEKGINIETELLNFRDYHRARGTKLIDWNSAFRVWLRNAS
nr:Uncharacterised protein [Klebsiella pneumoniae]